MGALATLPDAKTKISPKDKRVVKNNITVEDCRATRARGWFFSMVTDVGDMNSMTARRLPHNSIESKSQGNQ